MKINLAAYRTLPDTLPTIPNRKYFNQDDDYQIAWYAQQAGGGGGGGDATAENQVLQIAQETAINTKLANNIAGLPGTYGNMTLANAVPQIGSFVGVFGYTSINTQLASALTGAQTILIEVSSVTPYAWRTVATLDVNSPLHTEFRTAPFYWVRYTYSGTGTKGLAWLMTNQSSLGATAENQTALLTDIKDSDTFQDSVFKNLQGISVFKTKNDTDEPLSVFTNNSGEISHFEASTSGDRPSVFRSKPAGEVERSVFTDLTRERSIYDELQEIKNSSIINEKNCLNNGFEQYIGNDIDFSDATHDMTVVLNDAANDGKQIIFQSITFNTIDANYYWVVILKLI
jgi:hypothetical protein